jgi:DNA-binding XRE family transcriptional regulator
MESKEIVLKALGNKVKSKRKETGLTQTQLAYSIGKDQQSIQRLEVGLSNPSYWFLYEIAEGLNCKIADLIP